jgi:peptidoglycan hydrolase-like protein with peptidoglycan-binding domain
MRRYQWYFFIVSFIAVSAFISPASARAAALTEAQIQAIVGLLQSFGADQAVIAKVNASLHGVSTSSPASMVTSSDCTITHTLSLGSRGDEVLCLQKLLQASGDYTYPELTGYFGSVTMEAVQKYQTRLDIVSSGSPSVTGYGVVGPKTRASLLPDAAGTAETNYFDPDDPALSFTATPQTVSIGDSARLAWSAENVSSCEVTGSGLASTTGITGSIDTGGLYSSRTYILSCQSSRGERSISAIVQVVGSIIQPILSLIANSATVHPGETATLIWNTAVVNSCTVTGGTLSGVTGKTGSIQIGPLSSDTTYTLSCDTPNGPRSMTYTVSIQ